MSSLLLLHVFLIPQIFNIHLLERQIYSAQIYLSGWGHCPLAFCICEQCVIVVGTAERSLQFKCASPFKPEVPFRGPVSSVQIYCVVENEIPMVLYNVGMAFS